MPVRAEDETETESPKSDPAPGQPDESDPPTKPKTDPTQMSPEMKKVFEKPVPRTAPVASPPPTVPAMALRGMVLREGKDGMAMIEIEKQGVLLVKTGSHMAVKSGNQTVVVVVTEISKEGVVLNVPSLGETLRLR